MLVLLLIVIAVLLLAISYDLYLMRKAIIAASDLNLESQAKTRDKLDDLSRLPLKYP